MNYLNTLKNNLQNMESNIALLRKEIGGNKYQSNSIIDITATVSQVIIAGITHIMMNDEKFRNILQEIVNNCSEFIIKSSKISAKIHSTLQKIPRLLERQKTITELMKLDIEKKGMSGYGSSYSNSVNSDLLIKIGNDIDEAYDALHDAASEYNSYIVELESKISLYIQFDIKKPFSENYENQKLITPKKPLSKATTKALIFELGSGYASYKKESKYTEILRNLKMPEYLDLNSPYP